MQLLRSFATEAKRLGLADVQHIVAVASGKGGVGKSTVAGATQLHHPAAGSHSPSAQLTHPGACRMYLQ
jgi:Mrp family chromosome partitioning ATPase